MRIFYPYNEILPKKSAHDVYIFQECASFAAHAIETTLLIGKGSQPSSQLHQHYATTHNSLSIKHIPILRKNNCLCVSWNRLFFYFTQRQITKHRPDVLILSVFKQGKYHLQRKIPGVRYVYEVHELHYYPGDSFSQKAQEEKAILSHADLIIVTTQELKKILISEPYALKVPVEVIALAVHATALPEHRSGNILTLGYVGQLYEEQGVAMLLEALTLIPHAVLKIVGGKAKEVAHLQNIATALGIAERVHFLGFQPPRLLAGLVADVDIFVAPFSTSGRMPYVAHTKLMEYAEWKRPMIVPDLPVTREHFTEGDGVLFYEAKSARSLANAVNGCKIEDLLALASAREAKFTWPVRIERYKELLSQG